MYRLKQKLVLNSIVFFVSKKDDASEIWTIKKTNLRRIDSFEMTCWPRMLIVVYYRRNQLLLTEFRRQRTGIETLEEGRRVPSKLVKGLKYKGRRY